MRIPELTLTHSSGRWRRSQLVSLTCIARLDVSRHSGGGQQRPPTAIVCPRARGFAGWQVPTGYHLVTRMYGSEVSYISRAEYADREAMLEVRAAAVRARSPPGAKVGVGRAGTGETAHTTWSGFSPPGQVVIDTIRTAGLAVRRFQTGNRTAGVRTGPRLAHRRTVARTPITWPALGNLVQERSGGLMRH